MKQKIYISVSLLFFAVVAAGEEGLADATTNPLTQQTDISYLGAFTVPHNDTSGSCNYTTGANCFDYGGRPLAYNPVNGSLFIGGHIYANELAEITIPIIGGTASVLQDLADPVEGRRDQILSGHTVNLGGAFPFNGRLIHTGYIYYGPDGSQSLSHAVSGTDFSVAGDVQGFYSMNSVAPPRAVSGWMAGIPSEWQALLGGPALTGHCCTPGNQETSNGPTATVFDPDDIGVTSPIPGATVLYYPFSPLHPLAPYNGTNEYYNLATQIGGMAFPPGTRSVLFFGRQGTGPYCYGEGVDNPALHGTNSCGGDTCCYDPADSYKGTHAYPYRHQIWAYDANDLLAAKNGTLETWEPVPYALLLLPEMDTTNSATIEGATFDPASGRAYITEHYGATPKVHIYQIGTPDTTAPSAPSSLAVD